MSFCWFCHALAHKLFVSLPGVPMVGRENYVTSVSHILDVCTAPVKTLPGPVTVISIGEVFSVTKVNLLNHSAIHFPAVLRFNDTYISLVQLTEEHKFPYVF